MFHYCHRVLGLKISTLRDVAFRFERGHGPLSLELLEVDWLYLFVQTTVALLVQPNLGPERAPAYATTGWRPTAR